MMHQAHVEIGLVRLGDSDFVPANPENDIRGKDVYYAVGQRIGSVEDLYIDRHERAVRFLEAAAKRASPSARQKSPSRCYPATSGAADAAHAEITRLQPA